jgi:hypothetical protein
MDHFTTKAKSLLQDRNHGVLLAGITLVTEMCAADESVCDDFRQVSWGWGLYQFCNIAHSSCGRNTRDGVRCTGYGV